MGVRISNLPVIASPALSDVFPVVQAGVTYKESFTQLSSLFATAGVNANITSINGLTTPLTVPQGGTGIASLGTGVATALGVNVSGTGVIALNLVDQTWIPVLTFATPGDLTVVYATQVGFYSRVGNLIFANLTLICTPTFTTASGVCMITGLPFASNPISNNQSHGATWTSAIAYGLGYTHAITQNIPNSTSLNIVVSGSSQNSLQLTTSAFSTGVPFSISSSIIYPI